MRFCCQSEVQVTRCHLRKMHFGSSVIPYDFEPIRCENNICVFMKVSLYENISVRVLLFHVFGKL